MELLKDSVIGIALSLSLFFAFRWVVNRYFPRYVYWMISDDERITREFCPEHDTHYYPDDPCRWCAERDS